MIESYRFGEMVIDGAAHTSDVIILGGKAKSGWWRKEGHSLCEEDLKDVLEFRPKTLVVGTGHSGMMRVPDEVREIIASEGIELIVLRTAQAVEKFNSLSQSGEKVAGAFHLTC